jgi:serine phosphatase RsbU (regulator of sigma subunit)
VTEDRSAVDRELARLRARAGEQEVEIAQLREDAAEASDELAQLGDEARVLHRRELDLSALVERLRREARAHEDQISRLLERLNAEERELNDLRAIRDALTPPELASPPGVDLAASFLPATERVSGDFYLVAEGPHDATALVVGDVVGKGLAAARRAAFIRTVFATTAPFSDDPARLLAGQTPPLSNAPSKTAISSPSDVSPSPSVTASSAGRMRATPQCSGWTPARS